MKKVEGIASKIHKHKPIKMSDGMESKLRGGNQKSRKKLWYLFHIVIKSTQQDLSPRRGALWML